MMDKYDPKESELYNRGYEMGRAQAGAPMTDREKLRDLAREMRAVDGRILDAILVETWITKINEILAIPETAKGGDATGPHISGTCPAVVSNNLKALRAYVMYFGPIHDENCPKDDTCNCQWKTTNDGVDALLAKPAQGQLKPGDSCMGSGIEPAQESGKK